MIKILVIDDELFFREFTSDNLKNMGYKVEAVANGADGLDVLEKEKGRISAVLLDIIMPGMDGIEVLERIRKLDPSLPVIMMTAHTDQEVVLKALRNGAFDYLAKPLYVDELVLAVKRAVGHYSLVIQNENKLKQLRSLEVGAQRLVELTAGSMSMDAVVENNRLLQSTIDLISNVLDAEKVSMSLVDEKKMEMRVVVANGLDVDLTAIPVKKIGDGISGKVAKTGEPILVKDMGDEKGMKKSNYSGQYKTDSFMCVPIKVSDKIIGVISVNDKRSGENFSESDLAVLITFSFQVALSLENAMINADMQKYIEKLTLINDISKTLLYMVNPKDIFRDIVMRTKKALEAEACVIMMVEEATNDLRFEAGVNEKGEMNIELAVKQGQGVTGIVLKTGKMAIVTSPKDDRRFFPQADGVPGLITKELLCAPLKIKDSTLGVIKVWNKKNGQKFTPRDTELLESISSHASIALKNAWLYKNLESSIDEVAETNKKLERVNVELKKRMKELDTLKKEVGYND